MNERKEYLEQILKQAKQLDEALTKANLKLDYVIEIVLDRQTSKNRIMGRRLCVNDNNHPNNVFIDAIKPAEKAGKLVLCPRIWQVNSGE